MPFTKREPSGSEEPLNANTSVSADGDRETVKRRKRIDVDASLIISDGRSKRRRTPTPPPEEEKVKKEEDPLDPKDPERAAGLGQELYDKLANIKDKEGEQLVMPFMKLPNKRSFPDYYETIKHPMSLEMVQQKLAAKSYEHLKDVIADFGQIFNNAKRYNTKESLLFQWAKRLHKITRTFYENITHPGEADPDSEHDEPTVPLPNQGDVSMEVDGDGEREGTRGISEIGDVESGAAKRQRKGYVREGPTVYKLVKPVMKAIKDAHSLDGTHREIAGIFMELPDRRDLPDYYKVITNPISLTEIENRMISRKYETWEEFFTEVELMCNNAFTYNEDNSDVYKDAKQIKNLLDYHRKEISGRINPTHHQMTKFRANPPSGGSHRASPSVEPVAATRQTPVAPGPYLPALPKGVVTEEVVASLDRYPLYEQQAWAQTLPPVSMQIYRQIQAGNEARRRIAEGQGVGAPSTPSAAVPTPPLPQLAELPSAGRPGATSRRPPPPIPTVLCIDFAFTSTPTIAETRQAIRLHNMRGVVTHAVLVGPSTTDIELTAYISDPPRNTTNGEISPEHWKGTPEVAIRINGVQGNLPKFIFSGDQQDRPAGMRWIVSMPTSRAETKVDIRATKPGALAETISIYINRQM